MKIVHISTSNNGGAGLGASRLHQAMRLKGIESSLIVAKKEIDTPQTVQAEPNINVYTPPKNPILAKVQKYLRRRGMCLLPLEKAERETSLLQAQHNTFFTLPISRYDLSTHPLIKQADIIHLHWVENFLDYPSFFRNVHKPIVWTIRDENIGFGGFHYSEEYNRCATFFAPYEKDMAEIKRNALERKSNIHMVALSNITKEFYLNNHINNSFPVSFIPNGIDTNDFDFRDKKISRTIIGCRQSSVVFSFCSVHLHDNRKGLSKLITALERLDLPNVELICVGLGTPPHSDKIRVIGLGSIESPRMLSMVYSASDFFVMPSSQESFGKTLAEAMACGTPVIAFPAGIAPEAITEYTGILCSDFSVEALINAIQRGLLLHYDSQHIRNHILKNYSIEKVCSEYINLYTSLLNIPPKPTTS